MSSVPIKTPSTITWANIAPDQLRHVLGGHQDEELCMSMIPFYVLSTGDSQTDAWDYEGELELKNVLQLAADVGCWSLPKMMGAGNILITPPTVSILSTPPGGIISILNSINGKTYGGRRYTAIPANLIVTDEVVHTPMASSNGYGQQTTYKFFSLNPFLPHSKVHSLQAQVPIHPNTQNKAQFFLQPQTNDGSSQVSPERIKSLTHLFPFLIHPRVLFGDKAPSPRRTWAELQPWGTMPGGTTPDLMKFCNGIDIRMILMTGPNREGNINPLSLTWSLPDKIAALEVFCSAILDLHQGDLADATRTASILLRNYDQDTGSIWITPNNWISFDFFRIFIRNYVRSNMRFETFPAHGILLTNMQPKRDKSYRYGTNSTPKSKNHKQLSLQVPHPQNPEPHGRTHNQETYSGIHLRRLGRRLINYTFSFPVLHKPNFTFRSPVNRIPFSFFRRALNCHNRSTITLYTNPQKFRNNISPVVSRINLVHRSPVGTAKGTAPPDHYQSHTSTQVMGNQDNDTVDTTPNKLQDKVRPVDSNQKPTNTLDLYFYNFPVHASNIYNLEEGMPKPPRVEILARTTNPAVKVNLIASDCQLTTITINISFSTGPPDNISNLEEGMPTPPRVEKVASTKIREYEVRPTRHHHHMPQLTTFPHLGIPHNIYKPEEGTPTPLRAEKVASSTNLKPQVSDLTTKYPSLSLIPIFLPTPGLHQCYDDIKRNETKWGEPICLVHNTYPKCVRY